MIVPGPRNLLTDVDGIAVGNAGSAPVRSGVTVVLPDRPAVAAVDVRGGAPGTRETDALDPTALVDRIDAVVVAGGSAFGLDAAQGVMSWLAGRGRGFPVGAGPLRVPIVPSAILFDLLNGGDKGWGERPPYFDLGRDACEAAGPDFALGNAGAGLGAKAGPLKGGLGSASALLPDGLQVAALAAVNPGGSVVIPGTGTFWAWTLEQGGELGGQRPPARPIGLGDGLHRPVLAPRAGENTTIGVVATNARLDRVEARRLAIMAQDGLARAIRPVHTPFDGDTVFALATGRAELPADIAAGRAEALMRLGAAAADCMARAVARGVFEAESLGPYPAYREAHAGAFGV